MLELNHLYGSIWEETIEAIWKNWSCLFFARGKPTPVTHLTPAPRENTDDELSLVVSGGKSTFLHSNHRRKNWA